jgi:hypothetical protein
MSPRSAFALGIHHAISATLAPKQHRIEAQDRVTLPEAPGHRLRFRLHAGLAPSVTGAGIVLRKIDETIAGSGVPVATYEMELPPDARSFLVSYRGKIHHPVEHTADGYAGQQGESPGTIGSQGIFLSPATYWYPDFGSHLLTFDLAINLPPAWKSVGQGSRSRRTKTAPDRWRADSPQDGIYLVAAPFTEYSRALDGLEAMVFLREPDPDLAVRYLDATEIYIRHFQELLGPYPYTKFALVENFWETGYGMPSFTLLGPRVIRLPFILHSSYPHEILHNWWGNGVYVDYQAGNWSEGLTSYLADHAIREQQGKGSAYRRSTLQTYADYIDIEQDFPLREFVGRHGAASQAVGYGKTTMLFHMLRQEIGDAHFMAGLQAFYRDHRFHTASFDDLQDSFEEASNRSLNDFFAQWTERTGAPSLALRDVRVQPAGEEFILTATIEQTQEGPVYRLNVPIQVTLKGEQNPRRAGIPVSQRHTPLRMKLSRQPVRMQLDAQFDLFRRLDRREIPPAVSQLLGAGQVLVLLPRSAAQPILTGYQRLAMAWQQARPGEVQVAYDDELDQLPEDRSVWLFGWENRFLPSMKVPLALHDVTFSSSRLVLEGRLLSASIDSPVIVVRHPHQKEHALGWLASPTPESLSGLGRKLPHYGRYSYLAFEGDQPTNLLKGQWPVTNSPLSVSLSPAPDTGDTAPHLVP